MSKDKERVLVVLDRIKCMIADDDDYVCVFSIRLNEMLNYMKFDDEFGAEGEDDPRGDMRDYEYSMSFVHGVDD